MSLTAAQRMAKMRTRRKAELEFLLNENDTQRDRIAELEAEVKRLKGSNRPTPRTDWQGRPLTKRSSAEDVS